MVFFSGMDGYNPKDKDEIALLDEFTLKGNVLNIKLDGKDIFFFRNMDKEGFIQDALNSGVPMRVGKFLVPEFASHLGLNMADLERLKPLIDTIDEKHEYERVIYDSYLENGGFFLTDSQREKAYKVYKSKRQ
jgi:hypothetical protein